MISSQADRLAAEAAKAKASSDEAAKEAEERADEAEEAVEREGDGQGVLPTARTIGLGAVEQSDAVHKSNCRGASACRCGLLPLVPASPAAFSPRKDLVKKYWVHPTH